MIVICKYEDWEDDFEEEDVCPDCGHWLLAGYEETEAWGVTQQTKITYCKNCGYERGC